MSPLADAAGRKRIEDDLNVTLVVEAAAGTGKTTALIGRIVSILRSGTTTLDRIVAVTFTEKAAGEMKLRLRAELDRAREQAADAQERNNLELALFALELAQINTIHGFCADLLRERPIEAGVDPAFQVLDDAAAERLLDQAFREWFQHALSNPGEGLRRALRRRGWRAESTTPRQALLRACRDFVEHRDFDALWTLPELDRKRSIDDLIERFRALGGLRARARSPSDYLARALGMFGTWVERVDARELLRDERDYDGLEAELAGFLEEHERAFTWVGSGKLYGPSLDRQAVVHERDQALLALNEFVAQADADLAARLQRELAPVIAARETLKQKLGALDFVDLLLHTRTLLQSARPVRDELRTRFTHLFIDEFQDTDPLQAEVVLLLASDDCAESEEQKLCVKPGKLFVVGDPKQAIYRFRRADVTLYERIKAELLAQGAELVHLTTNFRSVPAILATVNAAFSKWMTGSEDGSQAEYVALTEQRGDIAGQPGVVALPIPEPYGNYGRPTKDAISRSFPQAVGAYVEWLIDESGWRVREAGQLRPIQPRHICLLFKRFQSYQGDVTRPYVRSLEARNIAHVLVGGRSFHEREEVIAIRVALEAIEWPDDELSVYGTLRGPLLGITDEELLCFRHDFKRLHPLRRFDPGERRKHPSVVDALELLRGLNVTRNQRPIADTVQRLLAETRAHASLAMWPTGEQALANAIAIVDAARNFESGGGTSFRAFVDALADQANRGEGSEAPIVEEGTEGVRLMTVHKAKGLEFPIVILCDPTAPSNVRQATRFVDPGRRLWAQQLCGCRPLELSENEAAARRHDDAELVRLAYVAATRAQDLLVVPTFGAASGQTPGIGWADALSPALYPAVFSRRKPGLAPGCPSFGSDTVLNSAADSDDCVAPGLHLAEPAGNAVVWWDPAALRLETRLLGGVRRQKLLADVGQANTSTAAHVAWLERRRGAVAAASAPSVPSVPMTELSKRLPGSSAVASVESTEAVRKGRPRGPRFGTLVHALLARAPFHAQRPAIAALSASMTRFLGATPEEDAAAVEAVFAALAHPIMRQASVASDVRRESPVILARAEGVLAEGIIDLAFRGPTGWIVVDFKTDDVVTADGAYAEQLELYVDAVQTATGEPTRGVLLRV